MTHIILKHIDNLFPVRLMLVDRNEATLVVITLGATIATSPQPAVRTSSRSLQLILYRLHKLSSQ